MKEHPEYQAKSTYPLKDARPEMKKKSLRKPHKNTKSLVVGEAGWPCVSPSQYLTAEGYRITGILSTRYSRKESLHKGFNS